jgi:2,4-dienoyl-CoA reductase
MLDFNVLFQQFWFVFQTVTLDGGEFRSLAGEFNQLRKVTNDQWDLMEQIIRGSNKKEKSKL